MFRRCACIALAVMLVGGLEISPTLLALTDEVIE